MAPLSQIRSKHVTSEAETYRYGRERNAARRLVSTMLRKRISCIGTLDELKVGIDMGRRYAHIVEQIEIFMSRKTLLDNFKQTCDEFAGRFVEVSPSV